MMVKRFVLAMVLVLLSVSAWADFAAVKAAYGRGDYATAFAELRPLAEQGNAMAQYNLGIMYANGRGVDQDYAQAYSWALLAAAQGYAKAVGFRDILAKMMTPAQIAEGQRQAQNFRPSKQAVAQAQPSLSTPQPAATSAPRMDIAGLQRQLSEIKGLIARKPAPKPKPKPASKFPTRPVAVSFAKGPSRPDDVAVIIGNADYSRGRDIPDVTPAYCRRQRYQTICQTGSRYK